MCGIFGIIEKGQNAPEIVFKGLTDIEYRGYDSWGIAYLSSKLKVKSAKWEIQKKVGFLPSSFKSPASNIALGHTRWATHGGVSNENAHPHTDCTQKLVLVHNGIVENFQELKKNLSKHPFKSQTDSEIVIHLIEEEYSKTHDLKLSVAKVFNKLEGLNAIVVSDGKELVACKIGSPLVVGKMADGFAVASDPNALLPFTQELLFLEDNKLIVLNSELALFDVQDLKAQQIKLTHVDWQYSQTSLEKFPHYMLKEICEQPHVIYNQIQDLSLIKEIAEKIKTSYGTYFIGCGTASYACMSGEYIFSEIAKKHVNFAIGSEFNYVQDFLTPKSLLIAVSQSGETIDIVEPVMKAKKIGVNIVALTNTLGSTLYRLSDTKLLLQAGPEKAVASTKAYIAMLSNMILLGFAVDERLDQGVKILEDSAKEIESVLKQKEKVADLADQIKKSEHMYVLGRGLSYPLALESALKIKEVSYIHAEGFASGELKHGTIALIEKNTPVLVYVPNDETKAAVLSNAMEVKSRGAYVIGVGPDPDPVFDFFFTVQDTGLSSILPHVVFAQLLGYYLAVELKRNPDKPRNLAKSVVVR